MIEQIKYINHLNEVIEFGKNGIFINYNTLRDYSWDITSANNKIASFKKGIVSKTIPVVIKCNSEEEGIEIRNRLFEVFEKDVLAKKNGRIVIGEYYLKCYITGSKKTKYLISDGYMHLSLTMKSDYPAWIKESYTIFRPKSALNTSESAEGREILIGNATNSILTGYGVYGKSEQKSYKGINLVDLSVPSGLNGVSNYSFDNETGLVSFDYDGNYPMPRFLANHLIGKKVYLYYKNVVNSNADASNAVNFAYKASDGSTKYIGISASGTTIPSDATSCTFQIISNNSTTVLSGTFSANIMVSSEATDTYEKYVGGASPNPSYPQDIVSVADDGDLVVKSCGKNLLENKLAGAISILNGLNFVGNEDGSVTISGTATIDTYSMIDNVGVLNVGETYILSVSEKDVGVSIMWTYFKADDTYVGVSYKPTQLTFTVPNDYARNRILLYIKAGTTVNDTIYPMIRKATITDSTYEPYNATQATIPLTDSLRGIKVTEGGNYTDETGQQWVCDTLEKYADGSGKLIQRVYSETITNVDRVGNSYIQYGAEAPINLTKQIMKVATEAVIISNKALGVPFNKRISTVGGRDDIYRVYYQENINSIVFRYPASVGEITLEQANADLVGGEVVYILAEPIETPLTAEQIAEIEKLQTFEGVTYITNEDDAYQTAIYSIKQYLDFPYGYEYDFTADFDSDELLNTSFVPVDFRMVIHGAVTNPSLFISGHEYNVDVTIGEGDYLTIDSQAKTIVLSKQDGTQVNCFNNRNRDSYVFEKIPSGKNEITSTGDLNIDITLLDERSEPRWI